MMQPLRELRPRGRPEAVSSGSQQLTIDAACRRLHIISFARVIRKSSSRYKAMTSESRRPDGARTTASHAAEARDDQPGSQICRSAGGEDVANPQRRDAAVGA